MEARQSDGLRRWPIPGTGTGVLARRTWLAYTSDESGHSEVYVRPLQGSSSRWLISTGAGTSPIWSRTRAELLCTIRDGQDLRIIVAPYRAEGDAFRAEKPRPWSERRYRRVSGPAPRGFDLHPDGSRVAVAEVPEVEAEVVRDKLEFIFSFFEELKRLVPTN